MSVFWSSSPEIPFDSTVNLSICFPTHPKCAGWRDESSSPNLECSPGGAASNNQTSITFWIVRPLLPYWGSIFQPAKLEFHPRCTSDGMSERLEERQRGIVGQAGSQAPGLYKDKSFPWNKKKKGVRNAAWSQSPLVTRGKVWNAADAMSSKCG